MHWEGSEYILSIRMQWSELLKNTFHYSFESDLGGFAGDETVQSKTGG